MEILALLPVLWVILYIAQRGEKEVFIKDVRKCHRDGSMTSTPSVTI